MLEFLVGCAGGDKEAFPVAIWGFQVSRELVLAVLSFSRTASDKGWASPDQARCVSTYPVVNRPTMRVPAMVVLTMGMTSCNSASKIL